MAKQKTIQKEISISGIGIHTACPVNVKLKPAGVDSGVNFVRTDKAGSLIKAGSKETVSYKNSPRRTAIGLEGAEIYTIEHFMAALNGLGIDNITVELDNQEMPGLDGSAKNYYEAIEKAGIIEQEKEKNSFVVREPIAACEDGASIVIVPADEFRVSYTLKYDNPIINTEFLSLVITPEVFKSEIAPARTFCLEEEAEMLRSKGYGQGANYDNTLVVGKSGVIKNKLRFENEFVRHKILDLIGDLFLLQQPIKGHVIALRSGHSLNLKLVKKIEQIKAKQFFGGIELNYRPQEGEVLEAETIMNILPHRDPFLFVDRVVTLERGKHAVGIKNVTINDYFFRGHFPGKPVMPGVIIIEAMAQVGGVMMLSSEENRGKLAFFMAINNVKFRKTVVPGDQLVFDIVAGKIKSKTGQVYGKAFVDGKVVAEADLMFVLADR